jgi:hypothetical protein
MSLSKKPAIAGTIAAVILVATAMLSSGWSVAGSSPAATSPAQPTAVRAHPPSPFVYTVSESNVLNGLHLGDPLTGAGALTDLANNPVGTGSHACTVVSLGPPTDLFQCTGTDVFPNGTVETAGVLKLSDLVTTGSRYATAITGGTGQFAGAKGQIEWTILGPGAAEAEVTIR